jgi:prepilin-type N-terminal cleavage/methylation domain-containing protein
MRRESAFTLIELLVVVTIIVVLLALLSPALDRAIFEAQMAVCAANLHAIGAGAAGYAVDSRRYYPARVASQHTANMLQAHRSPAADDRPLFRTFVGLNSAFNDPLLPTLDFETTADQKYPGAHIYFGWGYIGSGEQHGTLMRRLGDRIQWTEQGRTDRFRWMLSDQEQNYGILTSSHPDNEGVLFEKMGQDAEMGAGDPTPGNLLVGGGAAGTHTFAWWEGTPTRRGPVDLNFISDDLAAARFNDVVDRDPRMTRVPMLGGVNTLSNYPIWYSQLPFR